MLILNYLLILKMLLRVKILAVESLKRVTKKISEIIKQFIYASKIFDSDFINKKASKIFLENQKRILRKKVPIENNYSSHDKNPFKCF
jgi:hypothetical protein